MIGGGRKRAAAASALAVVLVVVGVAGCAGSTSEGGSDGYPLVEPETPEVRKTVRAPGGSVVSLAVLPTVTEVEPSPTCERVLATFHDGSQPAVRPIVVPPAPELRAVAVTKRSTRLEWWFHDLPDDCRPVLLGLVVDNETAPLETPTRQEVRVTGPRGSVEIAYPDFLPPPDVARAAAYSEDGRRSRSSTVLVERSADTPPDPPKPAPPVTAPAGRPVTCSSAPTTVSDRAGDVLTYAPG